MKRTCSEMPPGWTVGSATSKAEYNALVAWMGRTTCYSQITHTSTVSRDQELSEVEVLPVQIVLMVSVDVKQH